MHWYRYVDGVNDIPLTNEFGLSLNPSKYAVESDGRTEAKLTVLNAVAADEGYYYTIVVNREELQVQSNQAQLAVRRLVAHLPMDTLDDGVSPDVVGDYDLQVANDLLETNLATLADGVDELGGSSMLFDNTVAGDPNFTGQHARMEPGAVNYDDMTLAVWVNWNGGSNWQRIIDFGNDTNQYMFLTPTAAGSNLRFAIKNGGSEQILNTTPLIANEWTYGGESRERHDGTSVCQRRTESHQATR